MKQLPMLSTADKHAEIRRLYFKTTKQTIQEDLAKALDLLKSMPSEAERERATVYMEGMAQMRRDWSGGPRRDQGSGARDQRKGRKAQGSGHGEQRSPRGAQSPRKKR